MAQGQGGVRMEISGTDISCRGAFLIAKYFCLSGWEINGWLACYYRVTLGVETPAPGKYVRPRYLGCGMRVILGGF